MNALPLLSAAMLGLPTEAPASLANPIKADSGQQSTLGVSPAIPVDFASVLAALVPSHSGLPQAIIPSAVTPAVPTVQPAIPGLEAATSQVTRHEDGSSTPTWMPSPTALTVPLPPSIPISPASNSITATQISDLLLPQATPSATREAFNLLNQRLGEPAKKDDTGNESEESEVVGQIVASQVIETGNYHSPLAAAIATAAASRLPEPSPEVQPEVRGEQLAPQTSELPTFQHPFNRSAPAGLATWSPAAQPTTAQPTRIVPASRPAEAIPSASFDGGSVRGKAEVAVPDAPSSPMSLPTDRVTSMPAPAILTIPEVSSRDATTAAVPAENHQVGQHPFSTTTPVKPTPPLRTDSRALVQPATPPAPESTAGGSEPITISRSLPGQGTDSAETPRMAHVADRVTDISSKPTVARQNPRLVTVADAAGDAVQSSAAVARDFGAVVPHVTPAVQAGVVLAEEHVERPRVEHDLSGSQETVEWPSVRVGPEAVAEQSSVRSSNQASEVRSAESPSLPEFVTSKLTSTEDNQQMIEVQLDPPELGRLVIKLVRSESGLKADFLVSNESARQAVQNELPGLQRALEQAGITLNQFNVSHQGQDRSGQRKAEEDRRIDPLTNRSKASKPQTAIPMPSRRAGTIDMRV